MKATIRVSHQSRGGFGPPRSEVTIDLDVRTFRHASTAKAAVDELVPVLEESARQVLKAMGAAGAATEPRVAVAGPDLPRPDELADDDVAAAEAERETEAEAEEASANA